ncbi:MAG TPA: PC4/YdbC family ssDNA-binding protein [Clostridia bacterium]|nr:PC4/YdbC family ssDNA-binding protein [Clostridia bacterium]
MAEIKFDIQKKFGVLSENQKGWKKEVNLVSWNDRNSKLDIRDWSQDYKKMGKGITLEKSEIEALKGIMPTIQTDDID